MTHGHGWPHEEPGSAGCIEIGAHVCVRAVGIYARPGVTGGYLIAHDVAGDGPRCEGYVCVEGCEETWTATGSLEDGTLTLTPSILCSDHPWFHAHVPDGRWTGDEDPSAHPA